MDKVVYILGTGFSRPLGLPIMSDFLDKAKDMFDEDSNKYKYFSNIFSKIRELSYIKNFYESNLENIEEILSIIEMENLLTDNVQEKVEFNKFIVDVITHFTPILKMRKGIVINKTQRIFQSPDFIVVPSDALFDENEIYSFYSDFVIKLFNLNLDVVDVTDKIYRIDAVKIKEPPATYSIITLNYDLVLENLASHISIFIDDDIKFNRLGNNVPEDSPLLIKLHGSVDDGNIIPPTWNKTLSKNSMIQKEWTRGLDVLKDANHIRFIGYSLPITDAYIRYLFKAGVLLNNHLKTIDVICLDTNKSCENVFTNFIKLPDTKYHFINSDVIDYFARINGSHSIEEGHSAFLQKIFG